MNARIGKCQAIAACSINIAMNYRAAFGSVKRAGQDASCPLFCPCIVPLAGAALAERPSAASRSAPGHGRTYARTKLDAGSVQSNKPQITTIYDNSLLNLNAE